MRFYKHKGVMKLDMSGNLLLSKNDDIISAYPSNLSPRKIMWFKSIRRIHKLGFRGKCRASLRALQFIWLDDSV